MVNNSRQTSSSLMPNDFFIKDGPPCFKDVFGESPSPFGSRNLPIFIESGLLYQIKKINQYFYHFLVLFGDILLPLSVLYICSMAVERCPKRLLQPFHLMRQASRHPCAVAAAFLNCSWQWKKSLRKPLIHACEDAPGCVGMDKALAHRVCWEYARFASSLLALFDSLLHDAV